jgi:hypothetical protein
MRSFVSIVAAPALCLGLLGGIVWENGRHTRAADADPYHSAAKVAVERWSRHAGEWRTAKPQQPPHRGYDGFAERIEDDPELPAAAIQLLKPNVHFYRTYVKPRFPGPRHTPEADWQAVSLLVVQCRDPSDMSGHYPPNCYTRSGKKLAENLDQTWTIPGLDKPIRGKEYHFRGGTYMQPELIVIYNFFILPGRGIVPDMDQVRDASGDYSRRHYGATQVQVVFHDPSMSKPARDNAFIALMQAGVEALRAVDPPGL